MTNSLERRANALCNPNSGIANDYLNHFNEILLLIENLPALLPEMVEEMFAWKPVGYREYFLKSTLPGKEDAIAIYDSLDPDFRKDFESMVQLLDTIVLRSIALVAENQLPDGSIDPEGIEDVCQELAADLRTVLNRAADLVNHGYAPPLESPQQMADRIIAASSHKH
jgi:hypothetical protein